MDREQTDNLKRVAAHLRCAARRIDEHVDALMTEPDDDTSKMVDMTAKELARALKIEEGRGVADILYFWLEADKELRETVLNWPMMRAHFYDGTRTTNPDGTRTPPGYVTLDELDAELEETDEVVEALRETDDWNECPCACIEVPLETIGTLRRAVQELSWWITENRRTPANGERLDATFATARKVEEMNE